MNKLGLLYTASLAFLLYVSYSSLETWLLPTDPETKNDNNNKLKKMFPIGLKTEV